MVTTPFKESKFTDKSHTFLLHLNVIIYHYHHSDKRSFLASQLSANQNINRHFGEQPPPPQKKKKNTFSLGEFFPMRVGGVTDSQTGSKPLKKKPKSPENRPFRPEFHLSFSQISQKPWGGKTDLGKISKKKTFFFWQFP